MSHWRELRFSPPVTGVRRAEAANPKRARRKAGQQLRGGVGTRAQQAIALQRERTNGSGGRTAATDEAEEARRFQLRRQKKKEKHRGR